MNTSALYPTPTTDASRRLVELAHRHDELRSELSTLRRREAEDAEQLKALAAELAQAEARERAGVLGGGAAAVKTARAKVARVRKSASERAPEIRVLADAVAALEAETARHAREHHAELAREMTQAATAAAERLREAVLELGSAVENYRTTGARADALMRLAAPELARTSRTPEIDHDVHRLARQASSLAAAVAVPVPTAPPTAGVLMSSAAA